MADTRRSLSALQALLADNASGDISAQDMRDVLVSVDGENSVQAGAYSSLPGSGQKTGDLYVCTDSIYWFRWDGIAWKPFVGTTPVKLPPAAGWTMANSGSEVIDTSKGMLTVSEAGHLAFGGRWYYRAAPSVPYTATFGLSCNCMTQYFQAGVAFRSSGGKYVPFIISAGVAASVSKWDDFENFNTNYRTKASFAYSLNRFWLRLDDDNTNRICSFSYDRVNWTTFHTVGRTDFLTANGLVLYLNARDDEGVGGEVGGAISLFDYEET
jgi:hypothetical protein